MAKIKKILRFIFRLTPLRMSLIIMIAFLYLYFMKEDARHKIERGAESGFRFLELVEVKAYDVRFQVSRALFPRRPAESIVITEIDDKSVGHFGWPFPRGKWAEFLERMDEYGAEVVAFDVVFADEGEYLGLQYLRDAIDRYQELGLDQPPEIPAPAIVRQEKEDETEAACEAEAEVEWPPAELEEFLDKLVRFWRYARELEEKADQDRMVARKLSETDKVVLGWYGYATREEAEEDPDKNYRDDAASIETSVVSIAMSSGWNYDNLVRRMWPVRFQGLQTPVPVLAEQARHFGFFTARSDPVDGTIRTTPLIAVFTLEEESPQSGNTFVYPSLALEAVGAYLGYTPSVKFSDLGAQISIGEHKVPTDRFGRLLINWAGQQRTYPYYSVYDVITGFSQNPEVDPKKAFSGKIVFVGSTTIGAHDMRTTPFGTAPGVEMHATVADNILKGNALRRPDWFIVLDLMFIIVVGVVFGLAIPRLSAISGGIVAVILLAAYLAANLYFFEKMNLSFTVVLPVAEIFAIYFGITIYRYATEEREKRFIKHTFEHYLSPTVINQLVSDPGKLKLGGEVRHMTAFFSDIQGFTTISEKMKHEIVPFLNEYLTEMCDIILGYDGTVDKFEGDAIIAFFNAPLDQPDHAQRACLCSVDIQERMRELRSKWVAEGRPEIHMRIGLNTGEMTVGNMGSRDRFDYTIIGDEVNLAARLEAAGKQFKVYTMVSEATMKEAGDAVESRLLGVIRVVGKTEPVRVYELLGRKGAAEPNRVAAARVFERACQSYLDREFQTAMELFQKALEINPADGPSMLYIGWCEEYIKNPPPPHWDGVHELTSK